jgi:predicted SAM-dependent methyltransferase
VFLLSLRLAGLQPMIQNETMIKVIARFLPQTLKERLEPLYGLFNKVVLRGDLYQCPVCLSRLRTFFPIPDIYRVTLTINNRVYAAGDFETFNLDNYICPVCFCADRDRLSYLYLNKAFKNSTKQTLLHLAPEKALSKYLRKSKKYYYRTADLYMKKVDDKVDITDMTIYRTDSIDAFICSHVLEHVPDDVKALRELYRIVSPNGFGIIMAPILPDLEKTYEDFSVTTPEGRLKSFGQEDHVRVYGKKDFLQRLSDAGFDVKQFGEDFFGKSVFERHGINRKSILYVVEKKPKP